MIPQKKLQKVTSDIFQIDKNVLNHAPSIPKDTSLEIFIFALPVIYHNTSLLHRDANCEESEK
jgi:hypothetical protein